MDRGAPAIQDKAVHFAADGERLVVLQARPYAVRDLQYEARKKLLVCAFLPYALFHFTHFVFVG